jgi:hypothetical protein
LTGRQPRAAAFFFSLLSAFATGGLARPASAQVRPDHAYLQTLQARAASLHLAERAEWHRLLHDRPRTWGGGQHSEIGDPDFFLAKDGRNHPAAELKATLAAFFRHHDDPDENARCRYPARHAWLDRQLHFDPRRLPPLACPRLDAWLKALDPGNLYLVFASNDLDSPASMFGHTLLRLDQKQRRPGERYLAYAINYAAQTPDDGAVTYALRGITGRYIGYYSVMPYYDKIRQYQGFDHRDLWEYRLRLTPAQEHLVLLHLWELRGIGSPYYFFSRNCSYELLALLAVAWPKLDLTAPFDGPVPYTIPIDTVRALRRLHLLDVPRYEPSQARRLEWRYHRLDAAERGWLRGYLSGQRSLKAKVMKQASPPAQARMLEAAHDALYYRFQRGELNRARGLPLDRGALLARSHITLPGPAFAPVPRPATTPDEGHPSDRITVGWNASPGAEAALLRWRPAYHGLLDPPAGYLRGGALRFLDLGLLVGPHRVTLTDSTLIGVRQIGLRNGLFHPWSWQVSSGVRRYGIDALRAVPQHTLGGYLQGGPGMAWSLAHGLQLALFAFSTLDVNPDLRGAYALAAGPRLSLTAQLPGNATALLRAGWLGQIAGGARPELQVRIGTQWPVGRDDGIRLTGDYARQQASVTAVTLAWEHYF